MTDEIIPPRTPARLAADQDWRPYVRRASTILRQATARHPRFKITSGLALWLAKQRTPRNERRAWDALAFRDNIAKALAEIDDLLRRAARGDEIAKADIKALRIEAGFFRDAGM